MSYIQSLDNIPAWVLFIIATLLFSIAAELGFRVGKYIHERLEKDQNPRLGTILGASLGLHSRIPISIFATLYFVGFLAMAMMGYQAGLTGNRSPIAGFALILTFSIVLTLITDLERPRQEIFNVSQQAMVDLTNPCINI